MKQTDIKQVNEQLTLYGVPKATIFYSNTGQKHSIKNSQTAVDILASNWEEKTMGSNESFYLLLLNRTNKVNGIVQHSKGGLTGTVIDKRMILAAAVLTLSTSIILAHNHPSGNTQPSDADLKITREIKQAAEILDITVLDHVILTEGNGYLSMADEGLL